MSEQNVPRARRPRLIRSVVLAASLAALVAVVAPTGAQAASPNGETAPGYQIPLHATSGVGTTSVVEAAPTPRAGRAVNIQVTYNGFTAAARASFQRAVNIIKTRLNSNVVVRINANYTNLGSSGILGSAGPTTVHRNFAGAPKQNVWYVVAAANKRAGSDLNGATAEINANFNNQFPNWHFGSGAPPGNKYDFQTVVLHEIIHGLGSLSGIYQNGSQIRWDVVTNQPFPLITGTFVVNAANKALTTFANGSTALRNAATSNNVFFNGPQAKAANAGVRPRMFAPNPFRPGSSLSHWDENTYPKGNVNSLMTPFLSQGERNANPGNFTLGALRDSGW